MTDLDALRREIRGWLEDNAPQALRGLSIDPVDMLAGGRRQARSEAQQQWLAAMAERGWTAPTWPQEYGGAGMDLAEAHVLQQELTRLRLPAPLGGMGVSMIGPTLLEHGSEAQKREHLPKIARGEIRWCQGYSEPNAGSDLAALQTSAVLEGDEYVINGQKIWTSGANYADWMFMLVRTDPTSKHQGITFLLLDLDQPGVEIRPIRLISGASPFCECFFTNARTHKDNVVGEVNRGWAVGKTLLGHERTGLGTGQRATNPVQAVIDLARAKIGPAEGPIADSSLRDRIAQLALDQQALQLTIQRSREGRKAGQPPGPEASLFKQVSSLVHQRREELMLALRGSDGLGWEGDALDARDLAQTRTWLRSKSSTIAGGSAEVQRNIIAKRVLSLPG